MRIAAWQCEPAADGLDKALARLEAVASQAAAEGADLLVTPEMYVSGYNIGAQAVRDGAWSLSSAPMGRIGGIAEAQGIAILVGLPERGDDDAVYNTAVFFGRGGIVASYRKTHLFGAVDRAQFRAGPCLSAPFEFEGWRFALAICYDIEFPELARAYARDGVDAILVPTANMLPFDGVATRLVPARAEENSVYVVYANYTGAEGEFTYCGLSCICAPNGEDLARAGRGAELITADLDHGTLDRVRRAVTYFDDLRPDLYGPKENQGEGA